MVLSSVGDLNRAENDLGGRLGKFRMEKKVIEAEEFFLYTNFK